METTIHYSPLFLLNRSNTHQQKTKIHCSSFSNLSVFGQKSEENPFKSNIIPFMFIALCRITLNRFTFWLLFHFISNRNRYIHVQPHSSKSDSSSSFLSFFALSLSSIVTVFGFSGFVSLLTSDDDFPLVLEQHNNGVKES